MIRCRRGPDGLDFPLIQDRRVSPVNDNKNLILAFALALAVLFGWDYFFVKPQVAQQKAAVEAQKTAKPAETIQPGLPSAAPTAPSVLPRSAALAKSARVQIDTPAVKGSINLTGLRLDDIVLKTYRETVRPDSANIVLFSPSGADKAYFAEFGWSLSGTGVPMPGPTSVWTASAPALTPQAPVTFSWNNGQGLVFETVIATDAEFLLTVTQRVRNTTGAAVTMAPYGLISRTGTPDHPSITYVLHEGGIGIVADKLVELQYEKMKEDKPITETKTTAGWLGITDKYWLAALIPDQKAGFKAGFRYVGANGTDRYQTDALYEPMTIGAGAVAERTTHLFAGAKEVRLIDKVEKQLGVDRFDRAIDWGWFYFLTRPIFFLLDWLYKLLGNFGLAIIGLTIIVKLIMFPLANKGYASMNRMKLVQPKMKEIMERYKDDKPRQQQEMMQLYKNEKVNPLAGCMPIILQIPVFFALYKVLFVTLEMRHQPFYLWIKDLSAPDPLTPVNLFGLLPFTPPTIIAVGVLPIIMGVSMYLQQKLNPAPMDEIQKKIFAWMPFVFTFILAPFAAGLVLYWTVNNVLSIAQQWWLLKRHGVEDAAAKKA
jgi:YidC/Oxa1 family membrane protein insertase